MHARTHAFAFSRSLDSYRPRRLLRLSLLRLLLYTLPYFLRPVYITRDAYVAKYRVREESPRQGQLNSITRFSIFFFFYKVEFGNFSVISRLKIYNSVPSIFLLGKLGFRIVVAT